MRTIARITTGLALYAAAVVSLGSIAYGQTPCPTERSSVYLIGAFHEVGFELIAVVPRNELPADMQRRFVERGYAAVLAFEGPDDTQSNVYLDSANCRQAMSLRHKGVLISLHVD